MNIEIAPRAAEVHTNHVNALLHVLFCKIDNKTGWRLPTADECYWIHSQTMSPNNRMFRTVYWTSESVDSENANSFNFLTGIINKDKKTYHNFVRPVRTITTEV